MKRVQAINPTCCDAGSLDPEGTSWRKYLVAGEVFATKVPHTITTVLGSCVAVCLWDSQLRAGGMNHYMLAFYTGGGQEPSNRYGDISIANLVMKMESLGSRRSDIMARIYGGGNVLSSPVEGTSRIGKENVEVARKILSERGIKIIGEHVGDLHGRKLTFNTYSGELTISYISPLGSARDSRCQSQEAKE